jgi:hypothetical protein
MTTRKKSEKDEKSQNLLDVVFIEKKTYKKYILYIYTMCRFWNDEKIPFLDCPLYNPFENFFIIIFIISQCILREHFVTLYILLLFSEDKRQFLVHRCCKWLKK